MLNKRTMNNNSRPNTTQLNNCSSYSEHVDSILPTPILFAATETELGVCHSHEISTLQHVYSGLYSLHSYNRPGCNVYLMESFSARMCLLIVVRRITATFDLSCCDDE